MFVSRDRFVKKKKRKKKKSRLVLKSLSLCNKVLSSLSLLLSPSLYLFSPTLLYLSLLPLSPLSLSAEKSDLYLSYFAEFVRFEVLDSTSFFVFCFVLKMYFSLPQLFVFLFDVLSVAVFVIRDTCVKKPTCA